MKGYKYRETREPHEQILEASADAFIGIDDKGDVVSWDRNAETLFGWPRKEVMGRPLADAIIPKAYRQAHRNGLSHFLKTGDAPLFYKRIEVSAVHRSGREFPVELTVWPMRDESGYRFHAYLRDISGRKEMEASLFEKQTALENAVEGIGVLDISGRYVSVNKAFADILGQKVSGLIGKQWQENVHPDDLTKMVRAFRDVPRAGKTRVEAKGIRRNKSPFFMELVIVCNMDKKGKLKGYYCFMRDISDRKTAETLLRQKAEELEQSNSELKQFAYVVSHDLQEPLRMMANYAKLLSSLCEGMDNRDVEELTGNLLGSITLAQGFIKDLLLYAQVGTRKKTFEPTDSRVAVELALANLRAAIEESGAKIACGTLPEVEADPSQLIRLFQNLIANGVKFSGDGPPRIRISARKNGKEWHFSVSDKGIGIEPQYASDIFLMFHRVHKDGKYPGVGIGLAICKKIVEHHGGRIWVESKPKEGSTFHFTLPMERKTI